MNHRNEPRKLTPEQQQQWDKEVVPLLTVFLPWLYRAVTTVPVVTLEAMETPLGVDTKGRVYINSAKINPEGTLTPQQVSARIALYYAVGVWRILNATNKRRTNYTGGTVRTELWNTACTATSHQAVFESVPDKTKLQTPINRELLLDGLVSLKQLEVAVVEVTGVPVKIPSDITVEKLYKLLGEVVGSMSPQQQGQQGQGQQGQDESTSNQGQGQGQGQGQQGQDESTSNQDQPGQGNEEPTSPFPQGCTIIDPETETKSTKQGIPELDELELKELRTGVANDIQKHKAQGNQLPEQVEQWTTKVLDKDVIDPLIFFNITVGGQLDASAAGRKPTYSRRSRRQAAVSTRVILQGSAEEVKDLYIGVDVSGSMSDEELRLAFTAVEQLGRERGFNIHYFSVSTMPHSVRTLDQGDTPVFDRDQAGTDMRMAFEVFNIHQAQLRMVITDTHTPWPTEVTPGTINVVAVPTRSEDTFNRLAENIPEFLNPLRLPLELLD